MQFLSNLQIIIIVVSLIIEVLSAVDMHALNEVSLEMCGLVTYGT